MSMYCFSTEIFPTKFSIIIFLTYVILFINQGLLVSASKRQYNYYAYNTTTVVLLTEILKFISAVILYWKDNDIAIFVADLQKYKKAMVLYFVPAGLYCLYNNLAFVNLAEYDPATYFLLLQFRVVLTGIVFQVLFQKQLSRIQWLSMILLTLGCVLKEIHHTHQTKKSSSSLAFHVFDYHFILILVQVFASCFAGVYNEYLLKDCKAHFMLQNVFMYIDSITCNFAVLGLKGELLSAFTIDSVKAIFDPLVLAVIVNNTCIGICVSLFLRSMNSILKSFASAIELIFTAILTWAIFSIPIDIYTLVSILIITCAIILYSQNPVINQLSNAGLNETLLTRKGNDVK